MGSAAALAIKLIDQKRQGSTFSLVDTGVDFQAVLKVNRVATRPDSREYLKELIVSSATVLAPGQIVQASISGDRYVIVSLDPIPAYGVAAVNVALLYKINSTCDVFEYTPPSVDAWGQATAAQFAQRLTGIYGSTFTALPDEDQRAYGSRPDGIFTLVLPKTVHATYRPLHGDRVVTTDLLDGHARTWQVNLVDPDFHGPNAYKLLLSEDNR